jgi:lysozyme
MPSFSYDDAGLKLTKSFEGLSLSAYADQGGVWTIGYGHTGPGVHAGLTITQEQADAFLESDVAAAVTAVNRLVTSAINQNQFDALVDFAFNLGVASLSQSTLLRDVNAGNFAAAGPQFLLWDHVHGVVVPGLLRRRQAEETLFNTPVAPPAPPPAAPAAPQVADTDPTDDAEEPDAPIPE